MDTPTPEQPSILVPPMRLEEEVYESCPTCYGSGQYYKPVFRDGIPGRADQPAPCQRCSATGFYLAKRIVRRIPEQSFEERAALAQIKTLQAVILKGAATIEHAASLLDRAGKTKEAAETRQAAQAMRQSVEQG